MTEQVTRMHFKQDEKTPPIGRACRATEALAVICTPTGVPTSATKAYGSDMSEIDAIERESQSRLVAS